VLDREGVICGADGKSEFDRMRACFSRQGAPEAFLCAFDLMEIDGEDLRQYDWQTRRGTLRSLLKRTGPGLRLSDHLDGNGVLAFQHACFMGLEGIVAKLRDRPYRSGRCPDWVKVGTGRHKDHGMVGERHRPGLRMGGDCCVSAE
jgi:bifunctional non-homologous end joining protein LigD